MRRRRGDLVLAAVLLTTCVAGCSTQSDSSPAAPTTTAPASAVPSHPTAPLIYVQELADGTTRLMRREGTKASEIPTPSHRYDISDVDVPPTGDRLAFRLSTDPTNSGTSTIWTSKVDGSNPLEMPPGTADGVGCFRWLPEGHRLLLTRFDEPEGDTPGTSLATYDTDSGTFSRIDFTRPDLQPGCADPTPDGEHIVFTRGPVHREVWESELDGSNARRLGTATSGCVSNITDTSPDGRWVATAYVCGTGDEASNSIWILPRGTGKARRVVAEEKPKATGGNSYQYWLPRWSRDSKALTYYRALPSERRASIFEVAISGARPTQVVPSDTYYPVPAEP